MRTNVDIDDALMTKAMTLSGYKTTRGPLKPRRTKCALVIGHLERQELITLNHMLAVVIGVAD